MESEICISYYSIDSKNLSLFSDFEILKNKLIGLKDEIHKGIRKLSISCDFIIGHENSIFGENGNYSLDTSSLIKLFYDGSLGSNFSEISSQKMIQNILNNSFAVGKTYYSAYCLEYNLFWPNIDKKFCLHSIEDIYNFDCEILAKYPLNNDSFIRRSITIFNKLYFSENCYNSLKSIKNNDITYFSIPFVNVLSSLQKCAPDIKNSPSNQKDLKLIGSTCNIECTPQGSDKKRNNFSFSFKLEDDTNEIVFCEYHLKLDKCNNDGDSHYYYNRIYFGLKTTISKGKIICIGHIGGHI